MKYIPTIGLEIHIELATKSKMFCDCCNDSSCETPNKNICPICSAHPGVLPVINEEAVRMVVKTGLALDCKVNQQSFFERKNYFYPDLPKGYQISQYQSPLTHNGFLKIGDEKIGITRIHLEEDTGRLVHPQGADYSLVDLNRAGVPLMELVTEPDIVSADQARDFIKELQLILRYLGVSKADMEKGEMRCEVNISLRPSTQKEFGTKVEIKNLNSIRSVEKSIEYEIKRQTEILDRGEKVIQETRGFHDAKQITFSQREKEEAHDYRYFPEPDLPPLDLSTESIEMIKASLPELPCDKRKRFKQEYGLNEKEIELYIASRDLGEYFEKVISELRDWIESKSEKEIKETEFKKVIKLASNYIATDLQAMLKGVEFCEEKFKISPENFAEFIALIYKGEISSKIAKIVLDEMFRNGGDPSQIIADKGLAMVSDAGAIKAIVEKVLSSEPAAVNDYKKGKASAFQFLIGKVMAASGGKAKPEAVSEILKELLGK